jgi:uncharacterized protein (TIGR03067 family)
MRTSLLLALALAACGFAPAPLPKPKKLPDMAALAGHWVMTRYQSGQSDILNGRQMRVSVENETWSFHIRERNATERPGSVYRMAVDPKATPPQFLWSNGPGTTKQYIGSYALEGDTLSIVFASWRAGQEKDRPTNFATPRGGDYLIVLKRAPKSP